METSPTIFYDSEEYRISKTANGKFEVYDKNKKTAIGEFDTLRKATKSIKMTEVGEVIIRKIDETRISF